MKAHLYVPTSGRAARSKPGSCCVLAEAGNRDGLVERETVMRCMQPASAETTSGDEALSTTETW